MKVSLSYVGADRRSVPLAVATKDLASVSEHFSQVPVRLAEFQPVVTRRLANDGRTVLNVTWLYLDPNVETRQVENHGLPSEFDGCAILSDSLIIPTAPQWLEVGFEYARAVYSPLLGFDKKAAPGLYCMAQTHPEAFEALARQRNINNRVKHRFMLATLMSKWDLMKRLGQRVTEQERIDEYARATDTNVSTLRGIQTVKQRICRELRKTQRDKGR